MLLVTVQCCSICLLLYRLIYFMSSILFK